MEHSNVYACDAAAAEKQSPQIYNRHIEFAMLKYFYSNKKMSIMPNCQVC